MIRRFGDPVFWEIESLGTQESRVSSKPVLDLPQFDLPRLDERVSATGI
nr:hypothetical protein [Rhodococcus sp. (in: high G+C Gram-positive bacteria)]